MSWNRWVYFAALIFPVSVAASEPPKPPARYREHLLLGGGPSLGPVEGDTRELNLGVVGGAHILGDHVVAKILIGTSIDLLRGRMATLGEGDLIYSLDGYKEPRSFAFAVHASLAAERTLVELIQVGAKLKLGDQSRLTFLASPLAVTSGIVPTLWQYSPGARVRFSAPIIKTGEDNDALSNEASREVFVEVEAQAHALLLAINAPVSVANEPIGAMVGGSVGLTYVSDGWYARGQYQGNFMTFKSPAAQTQTEAVTRSGQTLTISVGRGW